VGVSVGYRLSGEAIWPAQIYDCKAAIRWLRANAARYKIDERRIGVTGHSAGGHLVALLGTSGDVQELEGENGHPEYSSRVACVVDLCGPSDFPHFLEQRGSGGRSSVVKLFGGPPADHPAAARAASPVTWASADDPPFLIFHGTEDRTVPFAQSETLAEALKAAGVDVTFVRMEGAGHGLPGRELSERRRNFFERHLRGQTVEIPDTPIQVEPAKKPTE
jgi:acetyl esterase/lipase